MPAPPLVLLRSQVHTEALVGPIRRFIDPWAKTEISLRTALKYAELTGDQEVLSAYRQAMVHAITDHVSRVRDLAMKPLAKEDVDSAQKVETLVQEALERYLSIIRRTDPDFPEMRLPDESRP
ncbi:MAG: hypothetical protein EA369_02230 [Bradymonadales bacterium]|nr:MAG: hypothetical protein EA369_02230 [Bradymonadales bacterium]